MVIESIDYAAEYFYLVWTIISFGICSGMFILDPVNERIK
jgi:hypothetical protein